MVPVLYSPSGEQAGIFFNLKMANEKLSYYGGEAKGWKLKKERRDVPW
jgi:hypothetical protein